MKQGLVQRPFTAPVLAATLVLIAAPGWAAAPELRFERQAVVIAGLAPEGRVALLGISRGFNGFTGYELRHDEVLTADSDGVARLELDLPVSAHSVWAAVELVTGEVGLGAPEGTEVREIARSVGAIDVEGRSVTERRRYADALWVRPGDKDGSGVWGARFGDGATTDEDGAEDLSIRAPVSAFVPTHSASEASPPERFAAGDVLVTIDPETLEISATRLAE